PTDLYPLSLHDALPIYRVAILGFGRVRRLGRIGVVAAAELLLLAEEAFAARDGERHDDPLPLLQRACGPDLHHFAHEFMAKNVRSEEHTSELQSRSDLV